MYIYEIKARWAQHVLQLEIDKFLSENVIEASSRALRSCRSGGSTWSGKDVGKCGETKGMKRSV
ncbi:MAG: hypothetical protein HC871_13745 [Rhizobiales bacterium]|nr:hypothetical protein [Hyphomicrobiales bacterium]